jgi:hypothetical protein
LLTYWFSYKDVAATTVTPLTDATTIFTMTAPGANGTANAAKINYTLNGSTTLKYQPFAGMGMAMNNPEAAYDLTGSTGITFYYKSDNPLVLEINLTTIIDDCNYYTSLPSATTWTKKTLTWSQFAQYTGWGTVRTWDLTKINKFEWKVQSNDGTTGNLWVDEVQIDGLALKLPVSTTIDKSTLASAITSATNVYTPAVEGLTNGLYPTGSKATLLTAITAASTVNTNTSATQVQVNNAVTTLDSVLLVFQKSIIVVLKTNLVNAINNANSDNSAAVEGLGNGQYPSGSKSTLLSAINAATTVNTNTLATQAQVDTAITTLNTAILAFQKSIIVVSKTELINAIKNANSNYSSAVEGSGNGQYPNGSKAILLSALTAATSVNTNTSVSQAQVNTAVATLDSALSTFQNSVVGINRASLQDKISEVNTTLSLDSGNIGTSIGNYSQTSWNTLSSTNAAAQSLVNNSSATQVQINAQLESLTLALTTFENSKITTAVIEVSNDPTIVYPNPCSDVLHIKSSKSIARITVINLLGIVQQSTKLNDVTILPVLTLSNGLYFISIQYGDGTVETVKFTKE